MENIYIQDLTERFLKYVAFDTQSSEDVLADTDEPRCPSTECQLRLAENLCKELRELKLQDVEMDAHGYVYATLPATTVKPVPTIGFIAHLDTSPDCSGRDVKPRIICNYDGGDIVLNEEKGIVTKVSLFPELRQHVGEDIIVTDGTTLLGADDKAGIAEIVTAMTWLRDHPEVEHGKIRIAFNPDEEIGMGARLFDVARFGCQWAYTIDGSEVGELEFENFNAASARIVIQGRNVHPGYAKGKMINAAIAAQQIIQALIDERPETTEGYEGFYHLTGLTATVEEATLSYIIRDHDASMFEQRKQRVLDAVASLNKTYEADIASVVIREQYRNMVEQLSDKPHITDIAREAITESCGFCNVIPIRGGTDGAQLSFRGLPCPNIFAGGLNFHGRHEYVPIQSMAKATEAIINICKITAIYEFGGKDR